jgi:hypothetical protein
MSNIKQYLKTLSKDAQQEQAEAVLSYLESDTYILEYQRHPENRSYIDPHLDILKYIMEHMEETKHPSAQEIRFKKNIIATRNMQKDEIINRRTGDKKDYVIAHLLSGNEIKINLKNVYSYLDLMAETRKILDNKKIKIICNNKCLSGTSPYCILEDETILNVIILNKY